MFISNEISSATKQFRKQNFKSTLLTFVSEGRACKGLTVKETVKETLDSWLICYLINNNVYRNFRFEIYYVNYDRAYTGCCTTFCKGGKTWFQIYLWLKIHSNKWKIYQRTQIKKNCIDLIWFQPSRIFFASAHREKFQVFFVLFCDLLSNFLFL